MSLAHFNLMRTSAYALMIALSMVLIARSAHAQSPLGTEISYSRSSMKFNGALLNGTFDFQFKLFDAQNGGNLIGGPITRNGIAVNNGVLKGQLLDFGDDAFNGNARFIDVKARQGSNQFLAVGPRQEFVPVPYALALPGLRTRENSTSPNIIGGFAGNLVDLGAVGSTICGGGTTGSINRIVSNFATIGGGNDNVADLFGTIGGGIGNIAGDTATVGGGQDNSGGGPASSIGGGIQNTALGFGATIGGGRGNVASGVDSIVAGGNSNAATGQCSFAAGRRAKANAAGTFVWADSVNQDFAVGGDNRFSVRATGGAEIFTSANLSTGVFLSDGSSAWASVSDRHAKTNVQEVDARRMLEQLCAIPITTWSYKAQNPSIRHIGPMAQDFHAAFSVGEDDKHITTIDADGVLFAAVQGLHQMVEQKDAEIEALKTRLAHMESTLARLVNSDAAATSGPDERP